MRIGLTALGLGFLLSLGGSAVAALLLVPLVAADPASARSAAFGWGTTAAAALLHAVLGWLGARVAARRLAGVDLSAGAAACLACAGPVLAALVTQVGVASQGGLGASLLVESGAVVGAVAGFCTLWFGRRRTGLSASGG
ncbi:hypothetical protein [Actinomadura kijaniata]|uniref:hypothetical protein n=1 Tax=Actinomadura kijaniata TaxID=46161 RepID=UPI00082F9244|nr:hypothetical protein [Actinomadura kijaniata]